MPLVSADVVFPRTVELLSDTDIDLMRVKPPVPQIVKPTELGLGYGPSFLMWEVPAKPDFVIDESDLPY